MANVTTTEIPNPRLRAANIIAVQIEQAELAGRPVWVVTWREGVGDASRRRWYPDEASALAHAAERADRLGLLLIDLRAAEVD